jgi:hypothetical protein
MKNYLVSQIGNKKKLRPQRNLKPGGDVASIDGSHDGAPTKNDQKRIKPTKTGALGALLGQPNHDESQNAPTATDPSAGFHFRVWVFPFNCALVVGYRKKKRGLCCKKIKKMALLSSFDMPWLAEHKGLPASSHFKIFLGFFFN